MDLKLDEEELQTIEIIAENGQCGRVTKFEIDELVRVYREAASRLQAPAVAQVMTAPRLEWHRDTKPGVHFAGSVFGTYMAFGDGTLRLEGDDLEFVAGRPWSDTEAAAQADFDRRLRAWPHTGGPDAE